MKTRFQLGVDFTEDISRPVAPSRSEERERNEMRGRKEERQREKWRDDPLLTFVLLPPSLSSLSSLPPFPPSPPLPLTSPLPLLPLISDSLSFPCSHAHSRVQNVFQYLYCLVNSFSSGRKLVISCNWYWPESQAAVRLIQLSSDHYGWSILFTFCITMQFPRLVYVSIFLKRRSWAAIPTEGNGRGRSEKLYSTAGRRLTCRQTALNLWGNSGPSPSPPLPSPPPPLSPPSTFCSSVQF